MILPETAICQANRAIANIEQYKLLDAVRTICITISLRGVHRTALAERKNQGGPIFG